MTDRGLLEMALDALDKIVRGNYDGNESTVCEALRARLAEDVDVQYDVYQDDEWQAGSNSLQEAQRYFAIYSQDGPCKLFEVTRRRIM